MIYLATHIGIWLLAAFAFGLIIGWFLWGQYVGIDMNRDYSMSASSSKDSPSGSIAVLSDSLLKTQRELEQCQQSLAQAESRLKDSDIRFEPSEKNDSSEKVSMEIPTNGSKSRDDLKKIYGIGPVIEGKLAELEITTYRQIAELSDAEISVVSDYINYFPGRIERDQWLESARELHREKYGEEL